VIFWASAEVFRLASPGLDRARKSVGPYLNAVFASSSLASLDATIRYVPIAMPEDMLKRYPARSKLRKAERVYECAPQLNYDVFVAGTFEQQLREYLRGVALSAQHLKKLGATDEQITEFEAILAVAVDRILAERPDQTRH
jgi:hypothetical protein